MELQMTSCKCNFHNKTQLTVAKGSAVYGTPQTDWKSRSLEALQIISDTCLWNKHHPIVIWNENLRNFLCVRPVYIIYRTQLLASIVCSSILSAKHFVCVFSFIPRIHDQDPVQSDTLLNTPKLSFGHGRPVQKMPTTDFQISVHGFQISKHIRAVGTENQALSSCGYIAIPHVILTPPLTLQYTVMGTIVAKKVVKLNYFFN